MNIKKLSFFLPACFFINSQLLLAQESTKDSQADLVHAAINPSRTECASPCTVVLSAENTTAHGLDDHGIWSRLSYYWDFDTDESDNYGHLYRQTYRYVEGDTSHEKGHVPMVTKTFLCEIGTCVYNVGLRAQNAAGDFDDAFVAITVKSEQVQWNAENTICVSKTLDVKNDWSNFDKACPDGAKKQKYLPLPNEYDGKLVLLHRGDTYELKDLYLARAFDPAKNKKIKIPFSIYYLPIQMGQSNFKIASFGNANEQLPYIRGNLNLNVTSYKRRKKTVKQIKTSITDADVAKYGWSSNVYVENVRLASMTVPESFQHIGLHKVNLDAEKETLVSGGNLSLQGGVRCVRSRHLDCKNVPFSKGLYVSSSDFVGAQVFAEINHLVLNISGVTCSLVPYFGITDSRFRNVGEHNIRLQGWNRFVVMRSFFRGQHWARGKQKLTIRPCAHAEVDQGVWQTATNLPKGWNSDPEGKTRADIDLGIGKRNGAQYIHKSRYQVIHANVIGDNTVFGDAVGSTQYQTNALGGDDGLLEDIVISKNIFVNDKGSQANKNIDLSAFHSICVDNTYANSGVNGCFPSKLEENPGSYREPKPIAPPSAPGT
jgi:hypothetical protein